LFSVGHGAILSCANVVAFSLANLAGNYLPQFLIQHWLIFGLRPRCYNWSICSSWTLALPRVSAISQRDMDVSGDALAGW